MLVQESRDPDQEVDEQNSEILLLILKDRFHWLGNMGLPMAINIANKGHEVYGYDIDPQR